MPFDFGSSPGDFKDFTNGNDRVAKPDSNSTFTVVVAEPWALEAVIEME